MSISNRSIRRQCGAVLSVPLIALVASAGIFSYTQHKAVSAEAWVKHTLDVETDIYQLTLTIISAQSAVREAGTIDPARLPKYQKAKQNLYLLLTRADRLTEDNPAQNARIHRLKYAADDMLLRLNRSNDPGDSEHRLTYEKWLGGRGIRMDAIVQLVTAILREEETLLRIRTEQEDRARLVLNASMGASFVLGIACTIFAGALFISGIIRRIHHLENNAARLAEGLPLLPLYSGDDEIGRLGAALDRASALLADKSQRLQLALGAADTVIWEIDPSSRDICYEGRFRDPTGTSGSQTLSLPQGIGDFLKLAGEPERATVEQELARTLSGGAEFHRELQVAAVHGEPRKLSFAARRYSRGAARDVVVGTVTDITERRRSEESRIRQANDLAKSEQSLREQTRILRCILDSMGDGVAVADTAGRFLLFNPAAARMLGGGPVEGGPAEWSSHYGIFLADGITPVPASEVPLARALAGEHIDGARLFVSNRNVADGLWISATARPLRDEDGEIWGGVVVFGDVTERERVAGELRGARDEAEAANHAKSEFLSRMSHELRTPLNSVIGFSQILQMHDLGERPRECAEYILKAGKHLLVLIDEVLDIARIEAGKLPVSSEPVLVSDAVHDAVAMVRPLADARGIRIDLDRAASCGQCVRADRQRLKQVLLNLLSNAVKYNSERGTISVRCEDRSAALRLYVTDTGKGVSEADQARLFVPFERLSACDGEVEGTGLGLALSKQLVEVMGGRIGVSSDPGKGSTFWIELQKAESPEDAIGRRSIAGTPDLTQIEGTRQVLYIEDNPANLRLMEHIVSYRPWIRLISAMQGRLGLELARQHEPDLILSDLHLPDITGREVLTAVQSDPRTSGIPVIIISADATAGQVSRLMSAGASGYVTKPLEVEALLKIFDAHLGGRADAGDPLPAEEPEACR